jgi:hypothetical protein
MFRVYPWLENQKFKTNPFMLDDKAGEQDSKQVWFAGVHSDIAGGYPEAESSAAKIPLAWVIEEAAEELAALPLQTGFTAIVIVSINSIAVGIFHNVDFAFVLGFRSLTKNIHHVANSNNVLVKTEFAITRWRGEQKVPLITLLIFYPNLVVWVGKFKVNYGGSHIKILRVATPPMMCAGA